MSFRIDIDAKSEASGRFLQDVLDQLQMAFSRSGMKQNELALILGVDRSVVNRRLTGCSNLTLRSLAEMGWAMKTEPCFVYLDGSDGDGCNHVSTSTTNESPTVVRIGNREHASVVLSKNSAKPRINVTANG